MTIAIALNSGLAVLFVGTWSLTVRWPYTFAGAKRGASIGAGRSRMERAGLLSQEPVLVGA